MKNQIPQTNIENIVFRKDTKKYRVRCTIEGKRRSYGSYNTLIEATEVLLTVLKYKEIVEGIAR